MAHEWLEPTCEFAMPVDFEKLQAVFLQAVEIGDVSARNAWLDQACAGNVELRQRVESLLAVGRSPHPLLNTPAASADSKATPLMAEATPGTVIAGRYKLLEQIGEGGMGLVWMAEQRTPVRRLVAVKLIKAGMDSRSVLTRFEAERQALAMMDHPAIARVFDGGTTDRGHPWFAMELVRGLPVTQHCDERRLSVRDRLQLFMQICSAVQHAHQKGVIHRDLKPTNVLVTEHDGRPVPKVIDFGLAKALGGSTALTDHTLYTSFGAAAGTPLYMAPEQVAINAFDVDTRADVYALGVLLYELLTGTTPLERQQVKNAAWDEIRRVIREVEPPRPSLRISTSDALPTLAATRQIEPARLSGLVRGDLDWIVLKALEKDRNRRYESAASLSADVGRHLADEPVIAAPPSLPYRAQKYFRKHRGPVIAASAVTAALILGIIGTTTMTIRYRAATSREAQRADSEATARAAAEVDSYVANIGAAQAALAAGGYAEARERLDACPRSRRGWEWKYLREEAGSVLFSIPRRYWVEGFSPDSSRVMLTTSDGIVEAWDLSGRPVMKPIKAGDGWVRSQFSSDETRLLTACGDGTLGIWNLNGERLMEPLRTGQEWFSSCIWVSPDGTRVLTAADTLTLWETVGDESIRRVDVEQKFPSQQYAIDWCRDGRRFITRPIDTTEKLWDVSGRVPGSPIVPMRVLEMVDDPKPVTRMLRPDGELVGQPLTGNQAHFSLDGKHVLTHAGTTVHIWDLDAQPVGEPISVSPSNQVNFSEDGNFVVVESNKTRVWNLAGRILDVILRPQNIYDSQFRAASCDGTRLVTLEDQLQLTTSTGQLLGTHRVLEGDAWENNQRVLFAPDGRYMALAATDSGDENLMPTLIVSTTDFDAPTEEVRDEAEKEWLIESARSSGVGAASQRAGEASAARLQTTANGEIEVRNAAGDVVHRLAARQGSIAALSNDGRRLATSGEYDNAVRFWDTTTWREMATIRVAGGVKRLEFTSDDSRLLVSRWDDVLEIWDSRSNSERKRELEARWTERQAARPSGMRYVDRLLAKLKPGDINVGALITHDESLSALERLAAMDALSDRIDETGREIALVWDVLDAPDAPPAEVQKALDRARHSGVLWPNTAGYYKAVAKAQYRLGQYEESLDALKNVKDARSQFTPLYKAMASYRLGDRDSSRKYLAQAQELRKKYGLNSEFHATLFAEAETLIGSTPLDEPSPASESPRESANGEP